MEYGEQIMATIANNTINLNKMTFDEEKYWAENTPTKFDMYTFEPIPYEYLEGKLYEEMTEEYKIKQQEKIHEAAVQADIIITTALIPGKKAPLLIKTNTLLLYMSNHLINLTPSKQLFVN